MQESSLIHSPPGAERPRSRSRLHRTLGADAASIRRSGGAWLASSAALVLAVAAVMPALLLRGLWATRATGDSPFLLQRVHQYAQALGAGEFPARVMADGAYGLGYPFWNFYAPLAYAVAAPIGLAGGVVGAIKVVALLCFAAAGLGAYLLAARTWNSAPAGLVAAAAYTFAPYHMVNLYVRGDALSELAAYAVAPWTLVALERARVRRSGAAVAGLALAVAAMALAHNVSALLFLPVALAYALWRFIAVAESDPLAPKTKLAKVAGPSRGDPPGGGSSDAPGELAVPSGGPAWLQSVGEATRQSFAIGDDPPSAAGRETRDAGGADFAGHSLVAGTAAARRLDRTGSESIALRPRLAQPGRWGPWVVRRVLQRAELLLWRRRPGARLRGGIAVATGTVLGALLAAWFWLPALAERDAVHLDENVTGYFRFDAADDEGNLIHFRGTDLVDTGLQVDYETGESCAPCRTGLVQVLAALAGVAAASTAIVRRRRGRRAATATTTTGLLVPLLFWSGVALATTVMVTPLSKSIWDAAPLLEYAQFPWRWLSVQALALAVLSGAVSLAPARWIVGPVTALALAGAAMAHLPTETLAVHDVTSSDLTTYELLTTNIGSTVRAEYLPVDVEPRPWSGPAVAHGSAGEPRVQSGAITSPILWTDGVNGQTWRLEVPGTVTATVAFPLLWFPGYQARLRPENDLESEGELLSVGPVEGSGWLAAPIPPGRWAVDLALGRTGTRALAEGLSLVALAAWLALLMADRGARLWRWSGMLVLGGVLAVAAARVMPVGATTGPVTMDMGRTPYPHRNPDGIRYGDSRLTSAVLTPNEIDAGQNFTVRLEWDNAWAGSVVSLDLVSPAEPVYHVPDIAVSVEATQSTQNDLSLTVPHDTASGLYFVRLGVANSGLGIEPASGDGFALGTVYLGPLRVVGKRTIREASSAPVGRMGDLSLLEAAVTQDTAHPDLAHVKMVWQTSRPTLVNYKTSVRLLDAAGRNLAQDDKEPVYGFYPTMAWRSGEQVADNRWLTLPTELASGADYLLEIVVYEGHSDRVLGRARVPGIRLTSPAAPPPRQGAPFATPTPGRDAASPPDTTEPTPKAQPSAAAPATSPASDQVVAPLPFLGEATATNPDS